MSDMIEISEDQAQSLIDVIRQHSDGDGVMLTQRNGSGDHRLYVTFKCHEARISDNGECTFS